MALNRVSIIVRAILNRQLAFWEASRMERTNRHPEMLKVGWKNLVFIHQILCGDFLLLNFSGVNSDRDDFGEIAHDSCPTCTNHRNLSSLQSLRTVSAAKLNLGFYALQSAKPKVDRRRVWELQRRTFSDRRAKYPHSKY